MDAKEFKKTVLDHLRQLAEDDPDMVIQDTSEIAEDLGVSELELYDHDRDTGPLFELMQDGKVWRYGERGDWSWQAAGTLTYNWD